MTVEPGLRPSVEARVVLAREAVLALSLSFLISLLTNVSAVWVRVQHCVVNVRSQRRVSYRHVQTVAGHMHATLAKSPSPVAHWPMLLAEVPVLRHSRGLVDVPCFLVAELHPRDNVWRITQ